jgi:hypothetical protein
MKLVFAMLLSTLTTAAQAEEPQQKVFIPFTVQEGDAATIQTYLNDQPAKFSIPVLQWLGGLEKKAQDAQAFAPPTQKKP